MNINKLLPFLDDDDLAELAKKILNSPDDNYEGITITKILPFMDDDDVDDIFWEYLKEGKSCVQFLPFVSDEALSKGAKGYVNGTVPDFPLKAALPFMEDDDVALIAKKCLESSGEDFMGVSFKELMPFLDDDVIGEIFLKRVKEGGNYQELLPFVDDDVLSKMVDDYVKGDCKAEIDMDKIYPFLDEDDIKKLFKYMMSKEK